MTTVNGGGIDVLYPDGRYDRFIAAGVIPNCVAGTDLIMTDAGVLADSADASFGGQLWRLPIGVEGLPTWRGSIGSEKENDMEFIVHLQVNWPSDGDPDRLAQLVQAEHDRAVELADAGILKRLWRIPGRRANWGLWEAPSATELHDALSSLPFFPWLDAEVHAVGAHPNDPANWPARAEPDR